MIYLSWNAKRMFNAIYDLIDGDEEALIKWCGKQGWDKTLKAFHGNKDEAMECIKDIFKSTVISTQELLETIYKETKDNHIVQKRLEAIKIHEKE